MEAEAGTTRVEVTPDEAGQRLDRLLADRLGVSRARVRHLLESGRVRRDGRRLALADKSHAARPAEGYVVEGPLHAEGEQPRPRPDLPLDVLAEGAGWLVVDKPAGRGVHPLHPDQDDTVLNAVVARQPAILGVGEGGLRSGVVHRLDVDTTGALVFATDDETWRRLRGAFSAHRVDKRYRALVVGRLERPRRLDLPLVVERHSPAHVGVRDDGRPTRERVIPLQVFDMATLVEVRLETGFLHQIRATLAHVGHSLLGDVEYGGPTVVDGLEIARPMLHAAHLAVDEIDVEVVPPADFEAVRVHLESLEGRATPVETGS